MKHQLLFILLVLVIIGLSIIVTWFAGLLLLMLVLVVVFPETRSSNEGALFIGLLTYGVGLLFLPLGIIPAYFLSMRSAEHLREKREWEIKHPRRLFIVSLLIPIILLVLLAAFGRNS